MKRFSVSDLCDNCNKFYSPGCIKCLERTAKVCGCEKTEGCIPVDYVSEDFGPDGTEDEN